MACRGGVVAPEAPAALLSHSKPAARSSAKVSGSASKVPASWMMRFSRSTRLSVLLSVGFGEGSEVRTPMAITVIGGLIVSTLLTLIVIPVVYSVMDRKRWPAAAVSAAT